MPTWQTGLEKVIGFSDPWHAGAAAERHCAEQRNAPAFARALDRDDPIALELETTASLNKKATDRFGRTARNSDSNGLHEASRDRGALTFRNTIDELGFDRAEQVFGECLGREIDARQTSANAPATAARPRRRDRRARAMPKLG